MDTTEHLTRVRQLASWMRGQRWGDADAVLTMAAVVGLMGRELGDADALLLLFNRYAAGVSTIVSTHTDSEHSLRSEYPLGGLAEKTTPPAPRPDNRPPVAYASTLSSPDGNFPPTPPEHDVGIDSAVAEKKFSDE